MTPVNITNTITKAIEDLSLLGKNPSFSSWDNNKTRYLNLLLLVSSISACCFFIVNVFMDDFSMMLCGGAVLLFNTLLYLLQYFQQPYLARTLTYLGYPLLFFSMIFFSKGEVHGEYAFFLMILLSVMFFRTRFWQLSMMLYVLVLFVATQLISYYHFNTIHSFSTIINDTLLFFAICVGLIYITDSFIVRILETKSKNKKLLAELSTSNDELRRLNYMVSHDLQTPLRQIVSFSDLALIANDEKDAAAVQDYIKQVGASARTLHTLTKDLLSLSHLDSEQLPTEELSVADLFAKTQQQFARNTEQPTIETEDNGLKFIGNATLLGMILQNLVENGLKYNENKAKHIQLRAKSHPEGLQITVQDNGIGISSKYQDKIFEPFHRLPTKETYQGTGLGLAIAKKVMEIHQGTISLESQEVGVKFILTFPHRTGEKKNPEPLKNKSFKIWRTVKGRRAIF